jgi:hypothetical protein
MKRTVRGLKPVLVFAAAGAALLLGAPAAHAATPAPAPAAPAAHASAALPNSVRVNITAAEKSATWGSLHVGDCQQDNGTIIVRADGTGHWSATTLTYHTHSGDIWHSNFDFYTTAGFRLFGAGQFNSPRMNDGNPPPRYFWTGDFTFNPADFNGVDIFKTLQHSSC